MPLQPIQVDCRSCGAKIDLQTGLRSRTFVCDYCGTVNSHEGVVAAQNLQELRERYRPWSQLRLGHRATLLGREYTIVGRIRCEEQTWSLTLAVYTDSTKTEVIYGFALAIVVAMFVYVMVNMERFFG